jgi:tetratricopeptide (TPR) repeat protein
MTSATTSRRRRLEAVAEARTRVRAAPDEPHAHVELALALVEAHGRHHRLVGRRARDAARHVAAAVHLAPDEAWTHHAAGLVGLALAQDRTAERCFREALALDPTSAALHNDLGVALSRQGLRREAVHAFGEASQLEPESSLAHDNARAIVAVKVGFIVVAIQVVRVVGVERHDWAAEDLGPVLAVVGVVLAFVAVQALRRHRRGRRSGLPRADRTVIRTLRRAQRRDDLAIGQLGKVALAGWGVLIVLVAGILLTHGL